MFEALAFPFVLHINLTLQEPTAVTNHAQD